jgi:hypothetical protein
MKVEVSWLRNKLMQFKTSLQHGSSRALRSRPGFNPRMINLALEPVNVCVLT